MPMVPEKHHGKLIIFALLLYAGAAQAGEQAVAPFRKLATPLADMLRPMSYPEIFMPEEEGYHPLAVGRTLFINSVDLGVAEEIMDRLEASDAAMRVAQLRVLGGAADRVPAGATAYAHRGNRLMVNVAAFSVSGQSEYPARICAVMGDRPLLEPDATDCQWSKPAAWLLS